MFEMMAEYAQGKNVEEEVDQFSDEEEVEERLEQFLNDPDEKYSNRDYYLMGFWISEHEGEDLVHFTLDMGKTGEFKSSMKAEELKGKTDLSSEDSSGSVEGWDRIMEVIFEASNKYDEVEDIGQKQVDGEKVHEFAVDGEIFQIRSLD